MQAGGVPQHLGGHEFLVNGKLADATEDAGEEGQHPPNVVGCVHIGRVEAGDHGIEAALVPRRQAPVGLGHHGIHKGVVVEGGIREKIVVGRPFSGLEVVPLLLQRNAEQRHPAHPVPHDLQKVRQADAPLDVVGDVEVGVVEIDLLGRRRRNPQGAAGQDGHGCERCSHETGLLSFRCSESRPGGNKPPVQVGTAGRVRRWRWG